jgi:hypothetical protein
LEKDKSPLKPLGDELIEIKAATARHVTLDRWYQIHPTYRAKMIAFDLYMGLREAFEMERRTSKDKKSDGKNKYEQMMAHLK